jgi:hypothetical protein
MKLYWGPGIQVWVQWYGTHLADERGTVIAIHHTDTHPLAIRLEGDSVVAQGWVGRFDWSELAP